MNAIDIGMPASAAATEPPSDGAPVRPVIERWTLLAAVPANVILIVGFFGNWSWQLQLAWLAPFALVWFAGWWRWQRRLDVYEVTTLNWRIAHEAALAARCASDLERGPPAGAAGSAEDWRFELRYQRRRAEERGAEAAATLAEIRAEREAHWTRRVFSRG